jgi:hypothetical protein
MRKSVFITAAFAILSISASAKGNVEKEVQMFDNSTQLIHVGIGINSTATPIELTYEKGIKEDLFEVKGLNLGVGGYLNYFGSSSDFSGFNTEGEPANYKWKYTNIVLGARALAHYKLIPNFDTYAGVMIGYDIFGSKLSPANSAIPSTGTSFLFFGGVAGIRYEFSPAFGVYLEGGSASVSNASIGIAYKF